MIRERQGPPREWWIAVSCVMALSMIPWVPLAPLFGVTAEWVRWFAGSFFGGTLTFARAPHDPSIVVFLPLLGAVGLSRPLLVLAGRLHPKRRKVTRAAWALACLLVLLAAVEVADALLGGNAPWNGARIGLTCAIGVSLLVLGIGLRDTVSPEGRAMHELGPVLCISGGCIASFVLLPVGLLGWIAACALLVVVLFRTDPGSSRRHST